MFNRIAIMGVGSLGTVLGAYITQGGVAIDLIDANPAHVKALNEKGAQVVGLEDFTVPVHALLPEEMEGAYDLYIYMAKQTFNDACLPQMKKHSHADTYVCTCQNGVPEMAVCEYFDKDHVMGAPVGWAANMLGPGVSQLNEPRDARLFHLGSVEGPVNPAVLEVQKILSLMCPTYISENLMGDRWSKLNINATLSGISVVTGMTFGQVAHDPITSRIMANVGRETVLVCQAAGIEMEAYSDSFDQKKFYVFDDEASEKKVWDAVPTIVPPDHNGTASMLQDIQRGLKKVEIDAINGVVCATGDKVGIETPYNDTIVWITKGIEQRILTPSRENLQYFERLYGKY